MIAGVIFLRRRDLIYSLPILGAFAYTNFLFFPLHVQPRYGLPVIPVLLALAGIGLYGVFVWSAGIIKKRSHQDGAIASSG